MNVLTAFDGGKAGAAPSRALDSCSDRRRQVRKIVIYRNKSRMRSAIAKRDSRGGRHDRDDRPPARQTTTDMEWSNKLQGGRAGYVHVRPCNYGNRKGGRTDGRQMEEGSRISQCAPREKANCRGDFDAGKRGRAGMSKKQAKIGARHFFHVFSFVNYLRRAAEDYDFSTTFHFDIGLQNLLLV